MKAWCALSLLILCLTPTTFGCQPDLLLHWPTPVISWDDSTDFIGGYRVYYRGNGEPFSLAAHLDCWLEEDMGWSCATSFPTQRADIRELEEFEWCVTAFKYHADFPFGYVEGQCSNHLLICEPEIWQPGEEYR